MAKNDVPVFTTEEMDALKAFAASGLRTPAEISGTDFPSVHEIAQRLEMLERIVADMRGHVDAVKTAIETPTTANVVGAAEGIAEGLENVSHLVGWLFRNNHRNIDPQAVIAEGREMAAGSEVINAKA